MSKSFYFLLGYISTQNNSIQDFESFEATTSLYFVPFSLQQIYKCFLKAPYYF